MPTVIEGIKFFTIPEIADTLRVTPQTVRNDIKVGRLREQRIGRTVYVTETSLMEFLLPEENKPQKKGAAKER